MTDQHEPTPGSTPDAPTQTWTPPPSPAAPVTTPPAPLAPSDRPPGADTADPIGRRRPLRWAAAIAVVTLVSARPWRSRRCSPAARRRRPPSLRPPGHRHLRRAAAGPARRSAPGHRGVPVQVPGLRRSGRPRDQAGRDPRPADRRRERADRLPTPGDIKPWFDGEVAFSVGPTPSDALAEGDPAAAEARALLLVSVKDQAAATTWFQSLLTDSQTPSTTETYQGVELTIVARAAKAR